MTWLNPAAFVGLLALAIPILVHLFGRRIAKRQCFPTLRLLLTTRATPATRSRPSDLLLLILRCAVVLAAVLALAQPRWPVSSRKRVAAAPVRLIVVDTSASMRRLTGDGTRALERARSLARAVLDSSREGMVVETGEPGANVAGASSWLGGRSGLRELVIISDFQVGALGDGHLASLQAGIGLNLRRVDGALEPNVSDSDTGNVGVEVRGTVSRATWRRARGVLPFTVSITASDSAQARVMFDAIGMAPGTAAASRSVIVAFPGAPSPTAAGTFSNAWQGELLLALRANRLLSDAARSALVSTTCKPPGVVIARNGSGQVLASINAAEQGVVIHTCAGAGSVAGTALLASTAHALTSIPAFGEREPRVLPDDVLRNWERPPTAFAPRGRDDSSPDGRWFWLAAIALLVIEQVARHGRKTRPSSAIDGVERERAA